MIKSHLLLSGAAAFAVAIAASQPAFAQETVNCADANDDGVCDTDQASADGSSDGTIVVTGSRIRLPNFINAEPTVTIDEQYIEERNLTNVADALNELPGFRGSVTPAGAQGSFGQGVNFVNNFGLGSNRTLTLVNGRRFVSSNVPTLFNQGSAGTQVDLNVIPTILVDRIDTVAVGGAPVYGSDAIAGTVNVILRTDFEGVELRATSGVTEEGDNFRYNVSGVAGMNFADGRGNVTVSYSRDRVNGVLQSARDFFLDDIGNATNPSTGQAATLRGAGANFANDGRVNSGIGFNDTSTDGFPGVVLVRELRIPFLTNGGLITSASGGPNPGAITRNFQFDGNGNLVPFDRGIAFVGANSSGGDGFRFSDYGQITSELRRDIGNAFATFEVSDALTLFAEGTYFKSRGDELVQQPTFNSSLFGGLSAAVTFDTTTPFLTDQARALLQAAGVTTFSVSRASIDLADPTGFSENELYRIVGGARGGFQIGGRDFNYEISGNYGRTNITDVRQDLNAQNFINAVNVTTNGAGQIVCTTTPTRQAAPGGTPIADPNCVPLNLLGLGRPSRAARDYVIATNTTESRLTQSVFNANIGGSFFDLPGGPLGFNVGYEHRKESGAFNPSAFEQAGRGRSVAIGPVSGSYNVDEVFGELFAPIVSASNGISFINRLEVFARGRYVDNTVNGGFFAWSAGGSFAPIPDIEFRGNYTKSFRAPAITELFLPASNAFSTVPDLCSPGNRNLGAAPAIRLANCTAFLTAFPGATPLAAATATVPSRGGGNPALENEVAKSFTYGAILRPRFIPGLQVSVDYIRINIENPIANLTIPQIASACFDNPEFDTADPANGNSFCSRIRRDATGQVVSDPANPGVLFGFVNGNIIKFSGIQSSVDYRTSLEGIGLPGSFEASGEVLYVRRRLVDITGVAPSRSDGTLGDPEFSGQLNLRYFGKGWGTATSFNYVGEQLFARTSRGASPSDSREFDQLEDYVTVNSSIYFDAGKDFRFTFAVTNLTNRQGQKYFGSLIPASINDALGRRYSASVRIRY